MPFISKDWRSPGEQWVKTREGWEKKKVLECSSNVNVMQNDDRFPGRTCQDITPIWSTDDKENLEETVESNENSDGVKLQPYCQITIKSTKEVAGFNALSDVLKRLDWRSAIRDRRRFKYITKLLTLLVSEKPLSGLPGGVQRVVFTMLEEVAHQVYSRGENPDVLRRLDAQLRGLVDCACWGRPLGSSHLWGNNLEVIRRVSDMASSFVISQSDCDALTDRLPPEMVTEILLRLDDPYDLSSAAEVLSSRLVSEESLWKSLVRFHFTEEQIKLIEQIKGPFTSNRHLFQELRKKFGLREEYADSLRLCRGCRSLFWGSSGHPCLSSRPASLTHVPISPTAFLTFFSL